jgi:hypothetical protein
MLKRTVIAALAMASGLFAQATIDFEGRYWIPQMSGSLRVEQAGFGTDIDARRDLGIPDTNFPEGRFVYHSAGRTRVAFSYTPVDYTGDNTVTRTLVFNGRQYVAGARVLSDLEVQHLHLSWAYQLINVRQGLFRLGPLVAADGFLMHGRLRAPALGYDQTEDLSVGLPTVGLALDINPSRSVNIYGEVSGLEVGGYGYFVGSDAGVRVFPIRRVYFTAGYRTFSLHVENSPDFARLNLHGPFVGAGFRF